MSATIEKPEHVVQREEQMRQAEEILGSMPQRAGVAKGLFEGRFVADWVFPYPRLPEQQRAEVEQAVGDLEQFCDAHLDPVQIDREADIPRDARCLAARRFRCGEERHEQRHGGDDHQNAEKEIQLAVQQFLEDEPGR